MKIYKRQIIDVISRYLYLDNIIVLNGARQVGKTFILYYLKNYLDEKGEATYYIDLEDLRKLEILNKGVDSFLKHLKEEGIYNEERVFVLLDEVQYLDNPSNFLKLVGDHHKNIRLIVSGSSSFEIRKKFKNSLVGRTIIFEIFNLSFTEFLDFKGYPYLEGQVFTRLKIEELKELFIEYTLYGGYPKIALEGNREIKEKYLSQIVETYIKKDIRDIGNIRDIVKFNKLLEVLASQSGNLLNVSELASTTHLSRPTVENYLFIMENTYILKLVRPFSSNLRSELFKLPKIFFYDSGLMQMLWLKTLPKSITENRFETAIFAELVKCFSKDSVYYWRTTDKKEIDFILAPGNRIVPIEVKLNFNKVRMQALNYFRNAYKIDEYRITGLNGIRKENHLYPWELSTLNSS
jgi:predicted AAA+ superfamily ATPase